MNQEKQNYLSNAVVPVSFINGKPEYNLNDKEQCTLISCKSEKSKNTSIHLRYVGIVIFIIAVLCLALYIYDDKLLNENISWIVIGSFIPAIMIFISWIYKDHKLGKSYNVEERVIAADKIPKDKINLFHGRITPN